MEDTIDYLAGECQDMQHKIEAAKRLVKDLWENTCIEDFTGKSELRHYDAKLKEILDVLNG